MARETVKGVSYVNTSGLRGAKTPRLILARCSGFTQIDYRRGKGRRFERNAAKVKSGQTL